MQVDPAVITGKTADESKGEEEGAAKRPAKVCVWLRCPVCGHTACSRWPHWGAQKVALPLNSNDRLFAEIRHMNVTVVGPLLQEKARELQQTYAVRAARDSKRRNACVVLIEVPADARTDTTCKPSRKSRSS